MQSQPLSCILVGLWILQGVTPPLHLVLLRCTVAKVLVKIFHCVLLLHRSAFRCSAELSQQRKNLTVLDTVYQRHHILRGEAGAGTCWSAG